jgi:O-antigen biosynthesis protein
MIISRSMAEARLPPYDPDQVPVGARRRLLDRVPPSAEVLDVGCWSGFAGRYLAGQLGAVVDGIEPSREMAARAAETYRRVLVGTAETELEGLLGSGSRYDALLFLDVLEHLAEPERVLRRSLELLRPGGRVYVSVPNVAHWSVRKSLLLGRFEYTASGLLDRTHLRFFTFDTAERLLTDSGLRVVWRAASVGQPPLVRLPDRRLRALERWPRLFGVQALFETCRA